MEDDMMSSYNIKTSKRQLTPENALRNKKKALNDGTVQFSPNSYLKEDLNMTPNSRKYQNRKNAGSALISFGQKIVDSWKVQDKETYTPTVKDFDGHSNLKEPYRFMFETLRDRAGHLDETICRQVHFSLSYRQLHRVIRNSRFRIPTGKKCFSVR